ncbi:MAG: conjugal transfer protein TraN [Nitrosomonadales bacterium]|nr:conjugal transfer protein TraN [Nitrosomonadales bacterium]
MFWRTNVVTFRSGVNFGTAAPNCTAYGECEIFKGKDYTCKKAVGGIQNCCDKPMGVSLVSYIQGTMKAWDLAKNTETVQNLIASGQAVAGTLSSLSSGVSAAANLLQDYPSLNSALISGYNSIVGGVTGNAAASATATSLMQPLYQAAGNFLNSISAGLGDSILKHTGSTFTGGLSSTGAGAIIGNIMTAYMYIQLAILIIQLAYACEKSEFELEAKRELKSCHYVGNYCSQKIMVAGVQVGCMETKDSFCCFSSPLARIMQEQGRPQIPKGWGSPESPDCSGYSIQEMSNLNYAAMDLTEWTAILTQSNILPGSSTAANSMYSSDTLTTGQTTSTGFVTQPTSTSSTITSTLTNPAAGESARSNVRSSMGF